MHFYMEVVICIGRTFVFVLELGLSKVIKISTIIFLSSNILQIVE